MTPISSISSEQYTYDSVGNRISAEGEAAGTPVATNYAYDWENRLTKVEYPGMVAQYKYDPFGRRIEKNLNGEITRYVYDGPNIVTEYDGNGDVKNAYLHNLAIDDILAVQQGTNTYYYHKDGLGSVVNLTDGTGSMVNSYIYKSFGEIYSHTGTVQQPLTFTGREFDPESGLYYYRARYYDSKTGRFRTKDPIGFAGGDEHLFRYVRNNSVNFTDPSGLFAYPYRFWISLVAGLAEGYGLRDSLHMASQSVAVDFGSQSNFANDTVKHTMAGFDPETVTYIKPHEAIMGAMQYSADQTGCGNKGAAMHPMQDLQAFWHAGQEWKGNNPFTNWDALGHWFMDVVPSPDALYDAYKISRQYLRQQRR